ncbi:hypothetical protein JCM5353_004377 [Sporobolomyces roseus]
MADDRFTYIHQRYSLHSLNSNQDSDDDLQDWDLPDDGRTQKLLILTLECPTQNSYSSFRTDIAVPAHLLPPYQDEDDETLLPSQTHPSYPYGNPYRFTSTSLLSSTSLQPPPSRLRLPHHPLRGSTHSASLSTSLPSLELPHLFSLTSFGDESQRHWVEQGLSGLLGPKTRREEEEDEEERDRNVNTHGDAGAPAGQNAADGPEDEEDDDEEGTPSEEGEGQRSEAGSAN